MNTEPKETPVPETEDRLESVRKRADAASPGPWARKYAAPGSLCGPGYPGFDIPHSPLPADEGKPTAASIRGRCTGMLPRGMSGGGLWVQESPGLTAPVVCEMPKPPAGDYTDQQAADCIFIAKAREDVPWLVAEVLRLRGELAGKCDELRAMREAYDAMEK